MRMSNPEAFDRRALLRGLGLAATATPLAATGVGAAVDSPNWQIDRDEFRAMGLPVFFDGVPSFLQIPIALTPADLTGADIAVLEASSKLRLTQI